MTTNNVMDLNTTDNHRTDARSLLSLLEEKTGGELDCNYISQRLPFQWEDPQINKFLSRILNNQPIPEIVVCETMENDKKISYLVEGLQRLSYAEEFYNNRLPVKAKGAEFTQIKYKKFEYDAQGNKILEDSRAKYTVDIFDITGKYYKDLPEFLQKRFDNFNIMVTRYFNCTPDIIDYHIRNYNNHVAMTKQQYGITTLQNTTTKLIKDISEKHTFFINNIKCTNKSRKRGILNEVVARAIVATYFMECWKRDLNLTFEFIEKNVTEQYFDDLNKKLDRMAKCTNEDTKDLLNTTNAHVWISVFNKFTKMSYPDERFTDFLMYFKENISVLEIDGQSFEEIYKNRDTKNKVIVSKKIEDITKLLTDYLHSNSVNTLAG